MSDGQDTTEDLPADLVRLLRDVPPADPATVDAHVAAALAGMPATVVRVDFRRRALVSVAAAALMVLGASIGWAARGRDRTDVLASYSPDASGDTRGTDTVATLPAKGATTTTIAGRCRIQVFDSQYVGEYMNPADGKKYAVYTSGGMLEFVDRTTCESAQLSSVPASAVSTTSAP